MVVALIAIAGAFASNLSSQDNSALVDRQGYIKDGDQCTPVSVTCSTIFNAMMCTSGSTILFDWNGESCPLPLYRKVN